MTDIMVGLPQRYRADAAKEAENCKADGGGEYFRTFRKRPLRDFGVGNRVYYIEGGFVRGFCTVSRIAFDEGPVTCSTTGRSYTGSMTVYMDATTWQWITPVPVKLGMASWRYAPSDMPVEIVGGWLDPMPAVAS